VGKGGEGKGVGAGWYLCYTVDGDYLTAINVGLLLHSVALGGPSRRAPLGGPDKAC